MGNLLGAERRTDCPVCLIQRHDMSVDGQAGQPVPHTRPHYCSCWGSVFNASIRFRNPFNWKNIFFRVISACYKVREFGTLMSVCIAEITDHACRAIRRRSSGIPNSRPRQVQGQSSRMSRCRARQAIGQDIRPRPRRGLSAPLSKRRVGPPVPPRRRCFSIVPARVGP